MPRKDQTMTYAEFKALEDALEAAYRSLLCNVDPRHERELHAAYVAASDAYDIACDEFQEA
jgi:hypothetical protein